MPKRPPEVLTDQEIRALLAGCSSKAPTGRRNKALLAVMWRTGLRIGEVIGDAEKHGLWPRDVDLDVGEIHVQHGKGDRARRVGIDPGTVAMIQRWLDVRPRSDYLFCTLRGGQLDQSYVRHLMRRLARKGGVEARCHPHALRHTFASEVARSGVPSVLLRDMLGHESLATTDTYLRSVAPREVIEAMQERTWA